MTSHKPRARLVAEGAVIVLSVLFAFWLEAAWSGRQAKIEERAALVTLRDEATANRAHLAEVMDFVREDYEAARSFFEADPSRFARTPLEVADQIIQSLWRPSRVRLQSGVLGSLTMSGQLGLIGDATLRTLLADWSTQVASIEPRLNLLIELELEMERALGTHADIQRWLMRQAQPIRTSIPSDVGRSETPESGTAAGETLNLAAIRENAGAMAAAAAMQFHRQVYLAELDMRAAQLDELIQALESAIEST